LTKIHEAAKGKNSDNQKGQKSQYGLIFTGENIVHNVLDEKRNRPVGGAERDHTNHAHNEIGPNIRFKKNQQAGVISHKLPF
jgi:hypothetical protein